MSAHSDDSESYLGDSAYEILTDSTILTDDEDDGTSSVASLDARSEDNVSLAETESLSGANSDSTPDDPHAGIPSFGGLDDHENENGNGSVMLRDDCALSAVSKVFDEPESYTGDQVHVVRTITSFGEAETAELCHLFCANDLKPATIFATIRQTMARQLLTMEEPFRVMYVGSTVAKDDITQKLAEALAVPVCDSLSSTSSWEGVNTSRYNIVPITSFGTRSASPEVQLVESGVFPEMAVDVCTAARLTNVNGRRDTIHLSLNGNQSVSSLLDDNWAHLENPGWKLPHLAVIYCSDDDNAQRRVTRNYAKTFMARHSVPTLVISQNPLYYKANETFALDTRSLHVCLESSSEKTGDVIHKRMPVDLTNFLSLDVRQMNRNLACITGLVTEASEIAPAPVGRTRKTSSLLMRDVEKTPFQFGTESLRWTRENKREDLWKFFLVGWLFIFGIVGATLSFAYLKLSQPALPVVDPIVQPVSAVVSTATVSTSTTTVLANTPMPLVSKVSVTNVPSCTPKTDLGSYLYDPTKIALNESDQFQIHVIGSNNLILRPPQKLLLLKRPPIIHVEVTRDEQIIDAELSKLFEGLYTLRIDEDEAWGPLNVAIWTSQKPILREKLEVDFGTPWLKVSGWKKAVTQKKAELQRLLGETTASVKTISNDLGQTAGQRATEVKTIAVAKAKEWTAGLAKVYEDTKTVSFKYWSEVDSKAYVRKAQSQAKNVWGKRKEAKAKGKR